MRVNSCASRTVWVTSVTYARIAVFNKECVTITSFQRPLPIFIIPMTQHREIYQGNSKMMPALFGRRTACGFTLVELLVVIAVIGILATIISSAVSATRAQSLRVESIATLRGYHSALQMHVNDRGELPGPLWVLQPPAYTGSPNFLATHLWPYFQNAEPESGSIPNWMTTRQYREWLKTQSSHDGKYTYGLVLSTQTDDGLELYLFGYPAPTADDPMERSNWNRLSTLTNPAELRIMYEVATTSRAPDRAPKPGEIQNHRAELFLDGNVRLVEYK